MTNPAKTPSQTTGAPAGDRIAKVLSRAGVASRREAERMIQLGQVAVNGKTIDSPALNVTDRDRITVDGQPIGQPEPARLWLYYKPDGLVTSNNDEKGRDTIFDHLPADLPRVMTVGRLDLNSEGLLLLTNDGGLKRTLELPSTGWLRKYRVRVNGNPTDPDLEPLRRGITIEGEKFQPMIVVLDRIQGANAWLTVGLREGKNREVRRAMAAINLTVNRLIRVSYGPFRLGELTPGEVTEVKGRVLRDQLGQRETPEDTVAPKPRARPSGPRIAKPKAGAVSGAKSGTRSPSRTRAAPATSPRSRQRPPKGE
ncbi:pseudouridine synthase [Pseudorhodobacter sp.]|uniref:pseudouridine synthase n=1 Tax=Pseudorhodobacter sp. TaxID=1934400 RepID=UPI0026494150|nr:pseudouridine synthase [Pseudorhodobacter sp.]MDN5788739.1 rRNA pseudouridine synthase [Pseudorhodobacter sp.]